MILLADAQALTTHFEKPELIHDSIYDAAMDHMAGDRRRREETVTGVKAAMHVKQ